MSALRAVRVQALGAISALVIVGIGCGGSTSSNNLSDGGGSSGSASGSSSGGGSGSSSGDATMGDDSSVPTGDDGGLPLTVDDAGNVVPPAGDGGTTPVNRDGGGLGVTTPPRGTDGGADQIACGGKACNSTTQVCCINTMQRTESCTAVGACNGDALTCTGSNSCLTAGDVCCGEATGGRNFTSKCETTCPAGAVQLCTTNNDCSAQDICVRLTSTFSVCYPAPPTRDGGVVFPIPDGGGFPTPGH